LGSISEERLRLARSIRDACIEAAKQGYESASISGLCEEGALEAAISAIHMVDLETVVRNAENPRAR
jgi:hypothetical protein